MAELVIYSESLWRRGLIKVESTLIENVFNLGKTSAGVFRYYIAEFN